MLLTQREYAKLRGVSEKTVYTWKQDGFLIFKNGKIDTEKSDAKLAQDHPTGGEPRHVVEADPALRRLKKKRMRIEADILRLEYEQRMGLLIPLDDAIAPFTEQCAMIRNLFLSIGSKMAPRLAGQKLSPTKVAAMVNAEVESILTNLTADEAFAQICREVHARLKSSQTA